MSPGLAVEALDCAHPGRGPVLRDVSFRVEPGEAVAVIGPSGAGKSTLLRTLATLAPPAAGAVRLEGEDLYGPRARERLRGAIGFIHQQHGLPRAIGTGMAVLCGEMHEWPVWKVVWAAAFGPSEADADRAAAVLRRVGLEGREADRVGELSVGERQRVAVARTLLQAPRLIVADEPTASVDPATADLVLGALMEEAERGAAVVCAIHDVVRARARFPRIIGLAGGIVALDTASKGLDDATTDALYYGSPA